MTTLMCVPATLRTQKRAPARCANTVEWSGSDLPLDEEELETLAIELTAHKNRFYHRGGFSPLQLVFGSNPRLPHELLSDELPQTQPRHNHATATLQPPCSNPKSSRSPAEVQQHSARSLSRDNHSLRLALTTCSISR